MSGPVDADPGAGAPGQRTALAGAGLWGLLSAFLNPSMAFILVTLYGSTLAQVGATLVVYNLAGLLFSVVIPVAADRRGSYAAPMAICAALAATLMLALYLSPSLAVATIALVVIGGPAAVGSSLFFADLKSRRAPPAAVIRARAAVSAAWITGPPLAALALSTAGVDLLLAAMG